MTTRPSHTHQAREAEAEEAAAAAEAEAETWRARALARACIACDVSKRCGGGARVAPSSGEQVERCVGRSAAPVVGCLSPVTVSGDLRGESSAPG